MSAPEAYAHRECLPRMFTTSTKHHGSCWCGRSECHFCSQGFVRVLILFCWQISFVRVYAVLSQNKFCRNLRALTWRKIKPKVACGEMTNIRYGIEDCLCTSTWPLYHTPRRKLRRGWDDHSSSPCSSTLCHPRNHQLRPEPLYEGTTPLPTIEQ